MATSDAEKRARVENLASSGNTAAQKYLAANPSFGVSSPAPASTPKVTSSTSGGMITRTPTSTAPATSMAPTSGGSAYASGAEAIDARQTSSSSIQKPVPGQNLPQIGGSYEAMTLDQLRTRDGTVVGQRQPFTEAGKFFDKTFWNSLMSPNATMSQQLDQSSAAGGGGAVGGGAGGGTGGAWGGTAPSTAKPSQTAEPAPKTGGASASGGRPGDRQVTEGELAQAYRLIAALSPYSASNLTSSSEEVNAAVENMGNALSSAYEKALADLPDYEKMSKDAKELYEMKMKLIDERRDQLEERYREDRAQIEADAEGKEQDLRSRQGVEVGKMAGGLAAAGAYLGFDNVNHSAMLSLQVTHDREMTVLGQAKIAAINEARRAFEDSDFALLGEQINAIESYDKKISELAEDHFNNTLKLTQEARDNVRFGMEIEKFERDKGFDNLDAIIESGIMPTQRDLEKYASSLNLSVEQVREYINSGLETKKLQKERDKTADELAIIDRLMRIDSDKTITVNGKSYRGLNTPASASSSSDRVLTNKDVSKEFGSSPFAYAHVGKVTYGQMVELYSQENPNADWLRAWEASNMDILEQEGYVPWDSSTYGPYYAMLESDWKREKANFWGVQFGAPISEFSTSDRDRIVGYLMSTKTIASTQELNDSSAWPYEVLAQVLKDAKIAEKSKEDDNNLTPESIDAAAAKL
jgi:hypothetical protein